MRKTILLRYGELALKSERVRRRFEGCLRANIGLALSGIGYQLRAERGRMFVDTRAIRAAVKRLSRVPGIVSLSPARRLGARLDEICEAAVEEARRVISGGESFAVRTRRVGEHEFSSRQVNEVVGAAILKAVLGARVDLETPQQEICVEVRGREAYVYCKTLAGPGGLPVGTEGRVVSLHSGDANSSAAAYLVMKRGCEVFPIFFDGRPHLTARGKARRAAKKLAGFHPKLKLRVVPFGKVLDELVAKTPRELTCVLCKRAMLGLANEIARGIGAEAVVSGEGSARVAELGLSNLRVIDEACGLPVLRPLAGADKAMVERLVPATCVSGLGELVCKARSKPVKQVQSSEVREIEEKIGIPSLLETISRGPKKVRRWTS